MVFFPSLVFVLLLQHGPTNIMAAPTCDVTLTQATGEIESPNYPGRYGNNLDCTTDIIVEERHIIVIYFDFFEIEPPETKENNTLVCYDKLTIVDVIANTSREYCGIHDPFNYTSTGNHVQLLLHTDAMVNRNGYHAIYKSVFTPTTAPPTEGSQNRTTGMHATTGRPNATVTPAGSDSGLLTQAERWMNKPWLLVLLGVTMTTVVFSLGIFIFCFCFARRSGDKDTIRLVGHYRSTSNDSPQ
ncbi:neuropilin-1a-like [Ptychodera flava]|uniref:neuropilin-1a-like n=1 Tax=Ptychodera flava TaxID=63121 RepID=UPI00396A1A24